MMIVPCGCYLQIKRALHLESCKNHEVSINRMRVNVPDTKIKSFADTLKIFLTTVLNRQEILIEDVGKKRMHNASTVRN